jgi:hypothetical protein
VCVHGIHLACWAYDPVVGCCENYTNWSWEPLSGWWWRQFALLKRRSIPTTLHGAKYIYIYTYIYIHTHTHTHTHTHIEWSKSHATHGIKGKSIGIVSLKQFITYKNIFKKQLQDFTVNVENDRHFLRSMYSHVSPCFTLLSLKFLGKYSIWQLHCFVLNLQ